MVKRVHVNMLDYGDKKGAYQALQEHYDRDTWIHAFWHIVYWLSAAYVVQYEHQTFYLPLFIAGYAIERAICRFIDDSNRNWAMHMIDWLDRDKDRA